MRDLQPVGRPDADEQFRALRHEFRTHVNNIVSYAALLLYDAEAANETHFADELRMVQGEGRQALAAIDRMLGALRTDPAAVETTRGAIVDLMESVRRRMWSLHAHDWAANDDQVAADLDRIASNARQLVALVQPL